MYEHGERDSRPKPRVDGRLFMTNNQREANGLEKRKPVGATLESLDSECLKRGKKTVVENKNR